MINWMKGALQVRNVQLQVRNVQLRPLVKELKEVSKFLEMASHTHVYIEHNIEADFLSKEGQHLAEDSVVVEEIKEGETISSLI